MDFEFFFGPAELAAGLCLEEVIAVSLVPSLVSFESLLFLLLPLIFRTVGAVFEVLFLEMPALAALVALRDFEPESSNPS